LQMAERLETDDLRVAAAAVGLEHMQNHSARTSTPSREKLATA
jgi:hypothetical protein